ASAARPPAWPAPTITMRRASAMAVSAGVEADIDHAPVEADRIGLEIEADRSAACLARRDVEAPLMARTFDDLAQDEAVGQMGLLMGAVARARVIARRGAIKGIGRTSMVEAAHILDLDVLGRADGDPMERLAQRVFSRICGGGHAPAEPGGSSRQRK